MLGFRIHNYHAYRKKKICSVSVKADLPQILPYSHWEYNQIACHEMMQDQCRRIFSPYIQKQDLEDAIKVERDLTVIQIFDVIWYFNWMVDVLKWESPKVKMSSRIVTRCNDYAIITFFSVLCRGYWEPSQTSNI